MRQSLDILAVVLLAAFISYREGMLPGLYLLGVATFCGVVMNYHSLRRLEANMRRLTELMEAKPK